jgi:site-specific DNA-methyltransferase (adenine-specific)
VSADHRIVLADCIGPEGLASLPDKSIDVTLTDPPYSRDLYLRYRTNKGRPDLVTPNGFTAANELASMRIGAIDDILDEVAAHILRVTKRWIVVFHDVEIDHRWRAAMGDAYVRTGAWVKADPTPQISGDRPGQGFEACTIAHRRGRKRWNGGGRAALWFGNGSSKERSTRPDHPCPKPLWLMEALIRDFTEPGELVLDPFAGSGTTLVAAKRLGRGALGFERDATYARAAQKRIDGAREQLGLFRGDRAPEPKQASLLVASGASSHGEGR